MADIAVYIHIPFCRQRCAYCHFDIKVLHPQSDLRSMVGKYLAALEIEIAAYADLYADRRLGSLFLGGGTPSRLTHREMETLLTSVQRYFGIDTEAEICVEANPEDIAEDTLVTWRELGINRVSFGVQTFHDPSLTAVRRPHNGATALAALASRPHFTNGCSMDLMLGLPYQNCHTLELDLDYIAELGLEHVSIYMLERDVPIPLDNLARRLPMPSEDQNADDYERVCVRLSQLGYQHYEISNFAKPGFACRHNLVYWRCGDYLGLGPAAHGRVGPQYWANHAKLGNYCDAVTENGIGRAIAQVWSPARLAQERLIQGLRLEQGMARSDFTDEIWHQLAPVLEAGLLAQRGQMVSLTPRGRLLANEVFQCLIPDNE